MQSIINVFKVPELRNKILFTLFMLMIYRVGYHIPLPGVDQGAFAAQAAEQEGAAGRLQSYISLFSGGSLSQSTIFGLGVMPYISASIIFQLLQTVVPSLEKLKKEGQTGQRKIQEWTRYATVPIAALQAIFWLTYMNNAGLVQEGLQNSMTFWLLGVVGLTTGCVFLMWLGEQIDEYGLGNGVSLIILAGIVARMPVAITQLIQGFEVDGGAEPGSIGPGQIVFLILSFVGVVAGSVLITTAQRRIPIQQAKHTRGRKVYGGQRQFLPLRVNHGGVMPIIFAQSLMLFPGVLIDLLASNFADQNNPGIGSTILIWLSDQFANYGGYIYIMVEIALIYFFAYFWTTVQFQPKEMANQLRDYGSFIPGVRPGKRTADYLERIMMRITFVGAAFLAAIAIIPMVVASQFGIPFEVSAFLGGTGLLIVVSVALDMVQRIEANLVMRNYSGFLAKNPTSRTTGGKGKRIRGSRQT